MRLASTEEIQHLESTIEHLEAEVQLIRSRQSALRRKLNEVASPVCRLSTEVLSDIFLDVCADRRSFGSPHIRYPAIQVIGQVCSSWRQIAQATASLWTRVTINFPDPQWTTRNSLNLLQLHYVNVGGLSLAIEMGIRKCYQCNKYPSSSYYIDNPKFTSFVDIFHLILVEHPAKLGSLTFARSSTLPKEWLEVMEHYTTSMVPPTDFAGFRNLTALDFRTDEYTSPEAGVIYQLFQNTPIPSLRHCSIARRGNLIQVPLTNVTSLHLSCFPIDQCIKLLVECPNLIEFRQDKTDFSAASPNEIPVVTQDITTVSNLKILHWTFGYRNWDVALMTQLKFPSLTQLQCDYLNYPSEHEIFFGLSREDYGQHWRQFLSSLPSLRSFGCDVSGFNVQDLDELWNLISCINNNLDHFHVLYGGGKGRNLDWEAVRSRILRDLTPVNNSDENAVTERLPRMRTFHYHDVFFFSGDQADILLEMLESRWNGPRGVNRLDSFTFWIPSRHWGPTPPLCDSWTEGQLGRLEALIEEGFQFVVREEED